MPESGLKVSIGVSFLQKKPARRAPGPIGVDSMKKQTKKAAKWLLAPVVQKS